MECDNVVLQVDCRECKVLSELDVRKFSYNKTSLVLGDFIITKGDKPLYVIERKTIPDLISSITDNRFREQKSRLEDTYTSPTSPTTTPTTVIYIIEEYHKMYNKTRIPQTTLESAVMNLGIIHNFKVLYSKDYKNTVDLVLMLYKKAESIPDNIKKNTFIPENVIKKSDVFYINSLACQLSVIPGVSWSIALVIQDTYKTMNRMITEFNLDDISSIQINKRRLGGVLAKRIQDCLGIIHPSPQN